MLTPLLLFAIIKMKQAKQIIGIKRDSNHQIIIAL